MTTQHRATRTIGDILRDKRGERHQTEIAKQIGVSRQMYRQWEDGFAVPGDEWVKPLMAYLDMPELDLVVLLYWSRRIRHGETPELDITWTPSDTVSDDWFPRPIDVYAEEAKLAA